MTLPVKGCLISVRTVAWVAMRTFYKRLLGEPSREKVDAWSWFNLPGGGLVIWRDETVTAGGEGRVELCLTVADLDAEAVTLAEWTTVSTIQTASHGRECYIHDPDGNRIVIYQMNA